MAHYFPVHLNRRAISLPYSSLERDFCRQRQAPQKGPEDDVSAQRPEIGDHHTREMAAKSAFLLASYQLRVSEDWVVETVDIELAAHHAVIELVSKSESGTTVAGLFLK